MANDLNYHAAQIAGVLVMTAANANHQADLAKDQVATLQAAVTTKDAEIAALRAELLRDTTAAV